MNKTKRGRAIRQAGFTMVELMVTMTIMMVLTAIGVVSFQQASLKSRDNRRVADLEKIRVALGLFSQESGTTYPTEANLETVLVPKYLKSMPTDPKAGNVYKYVLDPLNSGNKYTYALLANMESDGSTTPTDVSITCDGSTSCQSGGQCGETCPSVGDEECKYGAIAVCKNDCCVGDNFDPDDPDNYSAFGGSLRYICPISDGGSTNNCNYEVKNP